eukprot:931564-Prorocentrum_minimum.AAC.1
MSPCDRPVLVVVLEEGADVVLLVDARRAGNGEVFDGALHRQPAARGTTFGNIGLLSTFGNIGSLSTFENIGLLSTFGNIGLLSTYRNVRRGFRCERTSARVGSTRSAYLPHLETLANHIRKRWLTCRSEQHR